jgi:hypothetical protein
MSSITEFLLARIAEDEAAARAASGWTVQGEIGAWSPVPGGDEWAVDDGDFEVEVLVALRPDLERPPRVLEGLWGAIACWEDLDPEGRRYVVPMAVHIAQHDPARVLAECEAKRAIIKQYEEWPVLVERSPHISSDADDLQSMTFRITSQIAWVTEREYVKRFGVEPPTTPMIRSLAAVYKKHPGYKKEWEE